uniref:UPF0506 domain-containing protein n=1 Tax=Schistosoma mansoni TaxID=6183 RepID=A0A5K4F9H1_SCHMA
MRFCFKIEFIIICTVLWKIVQIDGACKEYGESCMKTVFNKCCGSNVCQLIGPFNGKCVRCIQTGYSCLHNGECCSRNCWLFRCK